MIHLRVLGALEVRSDGSGSTARVVTQPKRLALLLYLALAEPAGLHARERLLALLWPEADDESARHSLRNALHALRQALGNDAITNRGESWVGLAPDAIDCDALTLRAHLAAGRLEEALAAWDGELAPGFHVSGAPEFEHWLDAERQRLLGAVRQAAWSTARAHEGSGDAEATALRRALRLDPGNEPGTRRLMQVLADAGDRGGALRAWQELADWFARELEAEPSAQTQALAAALREPTGPVPSPPHGLPAAPTPVHDSAPPPVALRPHRRGALLLAGIAGAAVLATLMIGLGAGQRPDPVVYATGPAADAERAALRLPARWRTDTSAFRSYLRGLTLRYEFRFAEARDTLAALARREPLYVPGLVGLAHSLIFLALNDQTDPDAAWPRIHALAERALALDSSAASAWLALAAENMFARIDLPRAGEQILRARELDPLDADAAGMRSVWFRFHGQMDSAIALAREARRLEPLSRLFARLEAKQLYFARRYDESRREFARMLQDDPGWTRGYSDFASLELATGNPREAAEWLRREAVAGDRPVPSDAPSDFDTDSSAWQYIAADARRRIEALDRERAAGRHVGASDYAAAAVLLRDPRLTLDWLDSMITWRDSYLHQVRLDPQFDFVRSDARYKGWEERTGLPGR